MRPMMRLRDNHSSPWTMRNLLVLLAAFIVAVQSFAIAGFGVSVTLVSSLNWEQTLDQATRNDAGAEYHPAFVALLWTAVAMLVATCWISVLGLLRARQTVVTGWRLAAVVTVGMANAGGMAVCAGMVAAGSRSTVTLLAIFPLALVAAVAISIVVESFAPGLRRRSTPGANLRES